MCASQGYVYASPKRGFQMFFDKHPMIRKDEERGGVLLS